MKSSKLDNFQKFVIKQEQRARIPISGDVQACLDYCEYTIRTEFDKNAKSKYKFKQRKGIVSEEFMRAFSQLRIQDKIMYYNKNVAYLVRISNQNLRPPQVPNLQLETFAYTRSYNLKRWKRKTLRLNTKKKMLFAQKDQTIRQYNLADYLFRGSKNTEYFSFVLEAINTNVHEKSKTVHIGFSQIEQLTQWGNAVQICIDYKHWQRIYQQLLKKQAPRDFVVKNSQSTNKQQHSRTQIKRSFGNQSHYPAQILQGSSPIKNRGQSDLMLSSKQQYNSLPNEYIQRDSIASGPRISNRTIVDDLMDEQLEHENIQQIEERNRQHKSRKFSMDMFHRMFPDFDLDSIVLENNMEIIQNSSTNTRILQHKKNREHYKMILTHHTLKNKNSLKIQSIFCALTSPQFLNQLNPSIQSSETKTFISSENSAIVYFQIQPYNKLYRGRDCLFVRHVFRNGDKYYCADKKIQNANYPPFMTIVRAQYQCVWALFQQKQDNTHVYKIIADLKMNNQGLLNQQQNRNLTLKFLKGFQGIFSYVQNNKQKLESYQIFNLDWDVSLSKDYKILSQQVKQKRMQKQKSNMIKKKQTTQIQISPQITMKKQKSRSKLVQQHHQKPLKQQIIMAHKPKQIILVKSLDIGQFRQVGDEQIECRQTKPTVQLQFNDKGQVIINGAFIKNRYQLKPAPKPSQIEYLQSQNGKHPIWKGQWQADKKQGAILFVDQKKMEDQKGVLKFVLAKIGKNLLTGKSILSISLPVDIFTPQSNLELLVHSTSYAPLLIEPTVHKSAFDKFKAVVTFGLSMSVMYLNMEKPFNPILGQTFQAWIHKCPVYAQQISHHPPIASLLFCGRGYKITSKFAIISQHNFNQNGCGTNDGVFKFNFETGEEICFTSPGGEISGLTYGERKFNIVGKSYAWIQKQRLFVQIAFNPNKKGFFSAGKQANPIDYFQGHVVQVKQQFFNKFDFNKKKPPTDSEIVKRLGKFHGIWHKQIKYQEQPLINFDSQFPPKMQYQKHPLPSDANWRQDIAYRRLMQVSRAQAEKERLQVLQRYDKKLRGGHSK